MNALVTGATGFIGKRLVQLLVAQGTSVHVLCRPASNISDFPTAGVRLFYGDLLEAESIRNAVKECDRVYHLAGYARNWARDPRTYIAVNVGGLKNVLDAARWGGVRRIVVTSTSVTLGPSNGSPAVESMKRSSPFFTEYEYSKFLAEEEVHRSIDAGLDVVIVNPTRVFGPGALNEGNSVTIMIRKYLRGSYRLLPGDGSAVGNYAFVEDVVRGHVLAMERGRCGERYVLGGENVSYRQFFQICSEVAHAKRWMVKIPRPAVLGISHFELLRARFSHHYPLITPGWARTFLANWAFSSGKAAAELGYSITPLRKALAVTMDWIHNRRESK